MRSLTAGGAEAVGLKRVVEAVLRREGKMERRTEGGGMLVGGGPGSGEEAVRAGFAGWDEGGGVGLLQSSQAQSELGAEVSVVGFLDALVVVVGFGSWGCTAAFGG